MWPQRITQRVHEPYFQRGFSILAVWAFRENEFSSILLKTYSIFLCRIFFHGQNKWIIRLSVHGSVRTSLVCSKKLKSYFFNNWKKMRNLALNYYTFCNVIKTPIEVAFLEVRIDWKCIVPFSSNLPKWWLTYFKNPSQ